jgi:hypothetical protein
MLKLIMATLAGLFVCSAPVHALDPKVVDELVIAKTKAQLLVLHVKASKLEPSAPEYKTSQLKYTAAQNAFNMYTQTMLDNYKLGNKVNPKGSAELAYSQAKDFEVYVSGLNLAETKGFVQIAMGVGVLLEIAEKLYTFIQAQMQEDRVRVAETVARQVKWDDWVRIGAPN